MPSLTPQPEGAETLTALAEGAETLSPMAEGAETLTALAVFEAVDASLDPGTLPSGTLYPGDLVVSDFTITSDLLLVGSSDGPYPDPNDIVPASGLGFDPFAADALTLTPEAEV